MKTYYKAWFSNGSERTAGLVLDTDDFPTKNTSIEAYSRLFPYSESPKMRRLIRSSLYNSFDEAFSEHRTIKIYLDRWGGEQWIGKNY